MRLFECLSRGTINRKYLPPSTNYTQIINMTMSAFCIYQFCTEFETFPKGLEKGFIMAIQPKPNEVTGIIEILRSKGKIHGW